MDVDDGDKDLDMITCEENLYLAKASVSRRYFQDGSAGEDIRDENLNTRT